MRALIVEDTLINREFLKLILSAFGECHEADCGEQALDLFAGALDATPFDIVFMDVMLPGMDGLETLERMRRLEQGRGVPAARRVKVIVTSALDEGEGALGAEARGATGCIAKPVCQAVVERELRRLGLID
ncbi:response regulator [Pseudodesulfovibrio sp. F-1]|uniref:Response regulator n=1 Tax=Pseudodesulfovibrio alkaliphilus TaxID=2661613 RepID=A0A7K1KJ45_9BACT|nr:response regulator [Pseudodesulfovibrio alkaliphilus]MUM76097.1 response regulator [Pseudodesulfovibrio alkaliphilus]